MRSRAPAILAALVIAGSSLQAQEPAGAPLIKRIDSLVDDYMTSKKAPAVSVAVLHGQDTVLMRGYGLASREANRKADASTVYEIGSITKQFTSSGIMRLVERGKVSLDDPISKYVPDLPAHEQNVKIRQLLNHTSGVHNYTASPEWMKTWSQDLTPRQVVAFVDKDTLDFPSGTRYSYSNTGYVLLGMVIEKASGQPYATFVQKEFFGPLGLTQTSYCPSHPTDSRFAVGYQMKNDTLKVADYLSMTHPFSAGAICSTVRDLVKWQRALVAGKVVSPKSFEQMTTPDSLPGGRRMNYGFGLTVGQMGSKKVIAHGGGIFGFTTAGLFVPEDAINVAVFTNSEGGPDALAANIARAVMGIPLVKPPQPVVASPLRDIDRDRIPGVYDFGQLVIHVTVEGGRLMAQAEGPGQGKFPLIHVGGLRFGTQVDPTLFITFLDENGKITKAQFTQRGSPPVEGTRKP